ncbi:MAG TPA: hypothetical protein VGB82_10220 [Alphaproteobacteria bacterium]
MSARRASADSSVGLLALLALGFAFLLGIYSLHNLYFVVLALVPAGAAAVVEPRGQRAAAIAIAALTTATVVPLVLGSMTSGTHRDLLTSSMAWAYVGGAVLCGLAIFVLLPAGAAWRAERRAKQRIHALRARQRKIEEDWGPEVRTTVAH